MNTLQNIVLPRIGSCTEEGLFFTLNSCAQYSYATGFIELTAGGQVDFSSYFNQVSVNKWHHLTDIDNLGLYIEYEGEATITVVKNQYKHNEKVIAQHPLKPNDPTARLIPLPNLAELETGLLSFRVNSSSTFVFKSAMFVTDDAPVRDVKLGIAITAFRRNEYVIPALERLHIDLLNDKNYSERVTVTVIDNGGTLDNAMVPKTCSVIQNDNLGGSGGFARGLYHYHKEQENISHCLFMDDDASCESEAIKRTLSLLSYARNGNTAVAGAMMLERKPNIQHENGAYFDMRCHPLKHKLNLLKPKALLLNDEIEHIGYGAWWYFAFPIDCVTHYPFPYFVRGDDVLFSMVNTFDIVTLNGVCSWQESFDWKRSPMTLYLDVRSHITHYLLAPQLQPSVKNLLLLFWKFFLKNNMAYCYSSAEAICRGFSDALGPSTFWRDNMDMSEIREQLAPLVATEKLIPANIPTKSRPELEEENIVHKLFRYATLNGHLIPAFVFKPLTTMEKHESPFLRRTFGAKQVNIFHYEDNSGFVLTHSKRRFFSNMYRALKISIRLVIISRSLPSKSRELQPYMSEQYWANIFSGKSS